MSGRAEIHVGDCLDVMAGMEAESVDTVCTDAPYGIGFMGRNWDHGVPGKPYWAAMLRVAKPGALLLAFGGTRTWHRLACAIEDAGWEIRDTLMYLYGSGFPKSLDVSKAMDREAGAERERIAGGVGEDGGYVAGEAITPAANLWHGWGTALKPAFEPILLAMKPLDGTYAQNALKHGVAGLWVDGGRIGTEGGGTHCTNRDENGKCRGHENAGRSTSGETVHGPESAAGRWPANLLLDPRAAELLDEASGEQRDGVAIRRNVSGKPQSGLLGKGADGPDLGYGGSGGPSRFFYTAKVSTAERHGTDGAGGTAASNDHPTVKPVELMAYLCTLTKTPTGGVVLDPFMGSGSTGIAALRVGRSFIGIEKEPEYAAIAEKRIREDAPLFNQVTVKETTT